MTSQTKLYDVVGTGRSFVDVIAHVPYEFIERFKIPLDGGYYPEVSIFRQIWDALPEKVYAAGGVVPNTMAGLVALGSRTGYFSKTANDDIGRFFQNDMTQRGIVDLCRNPIEQQDMLSGTCIVLLTPGGERSFVLHVGCADHYEESDFASFDFSTSANFIVQSNQLSDTSRGIEVFPAIDLATQRAVDADCRVILSLSVVHSWKGHEDYLKNVLIQRASVIVGNESECEACFAVTGALADTDKLIITTRGAKGATARRGTQEFHVKAKEHPRFASSLGAGDQFLAGYLKADTMGLPMDKCLELAVRCADAIIQEKEARPAVGVSWSHLLD